MKKFGRAILLRVYHVSEAVQAAVRCIMVAGALTRFAWIHTVYDLKATQMNVSRNLIRELMLYDFLTGANCHRSIQKHLLCERDGKMQLITIQYCPVGCGCIIHRLFLCRVVRLPQRMSCIDTKQSNSKASGILELWRMQGTPSLPSLQVHSWLEY